MTSLPVDAILVRGFSAWLIGIAAIAAVSTYTAQPYRINRPAPSWVLFPLLLGKIGLYLGPVAVSIATAKLMQNFDRAWALGGAVLVLTISLWTGAIVTQVAQNMGYKAVGAKQRPIRFFDYQPRKKSRARRVD